MLGLVGTGHSVAFSPDWSRIASASYDNTVKLWDAATGRETVTLQGHTDQVGSIAFSPDGTRIASASWDRTVRLWDAATGQETGTLQGHAGPVMHVTFSPDGARIVSTAVWDRTVKLWDTTTGQETLTLKQAQGAGAPNFSPDGTLIAWVVGNAEQLQLFEASRQSSETELRALNVRRWAWSVVKSPQWTHNAYRGTFKTLQALEQREPPVADDLMILGVAQFRVGDFQTSVTTLQRSMELRAGDDVKAWFLLAMAHWQLDEKPRARDWFQKAVKWCEKYKSAGDEIQRFWAEAAELLGETPPAPRPTGSAERR